VRHYLKSLIIAAISFYAAYNLIPTIGLGPDPKNFAIVILGVLVTSVIIHPIFSLVLLPINILTFGLLSLVLNIALLYSLARFLPGFSISSYNFPGASIEGFVIPATNLNQIESLIAAAVIITIVQKILHIIFE